MEIYKENIKATGIDVKSHWSKICIEQEIPFKSRLSIQFGYTKYMCVAVHCHHYTPPLELFSFKNWTLPNWATASYPLLWLQQPISSFDFVSKWSVPQRSAHVTSVVQSETGKGRLKSFTNSSCSGRRAVAPMLSYLPALSHHVFPASYVL